MTVLSCRNLTKAYVLGEQVTPVLHDVSLAIRANEFVAVMGPSGSGKSTLLHCLGLLEPIDQGELSVLGEQTAALSDRAKARMRRSHMGFVFQSFYLVPGLSVRENILLPLFINRIRLDRDARVDRMLDQVGLSHRAAYRPNQLSGGEQQRCALARALIGHPDLLFLDEPTGNLDSQNGADILRLVSEAVRSSHVTAIMVTHDLAAARCCDRIITIRDGRIERISSNRQAAVKEVPDDDT
ncbi:MAG: ABC transporter ATP-binding protein [Clostridiaceae bacterium]|jgi:putative ABC transport system ATP-binding protein|nr:ABC transporter ATP-binding protein [Clostridiaceae bacterium]